MSVLLPRLTSILQPVWLGWPANRSIKTPASIAIRVIEVLKYPGRNDPVRNDPCEPTLCELVLWANEPDSVLPGSRPMQY